MTETNKNYIRWYKVEEHTQEPTKQIIKIKLSVTSMDGEESYSCLCTWFYLVDEGQYYCSESELKIDPLELPLISITSDFWEMLRNRFYLSQFDGVDLKLLRQLLREYKFVEQKKKPEVKARSR